MARSLALVFLFTGVLHAEDAVALLRFVPPQANTICVINTASLLASPRAVKEGWNRMEHTEYLAGAVPLNPNVQFMLLAKDTDPTNLGTGGTLALMPLVKTLTLDDLARMNGGKVTTIADEPAELSPTGVYYVKLGDSLLGSARTDNKQEVARWVKFTKTAKESQLHRVLNATAAQSASHHISIGVDTEEMFHDHEVEAACAVSKTLMAAADQAKLIQGFVKKLNGIVLTADLVAAGIEMKIRFDSRAYDFKIQPDVFKGFIIETLSRNGAMLTDMQTAKMTAGDNSLTMTFQISDEELARVMSLVLPTAAFPSNRESIGVVDGKPNAAATLKYFNAVNAVVDDLLAQNKKAKDYEKTALWNATAASKIASISTIGVDPTVVQYGYATAGRLQAIADSLRGVPAKVDELGSQIYAISNNVGLGLWGGRRRWGGMGVGGGGLVTNAGDIINQQAKVIKDDEKNRDKIWGMIDGQRSEIRAKIVETYKVVPPEKK